MEQLALTRESACPEAENLVRFQKKRKKGRGEKSLIIIKFKTNQLLNSNKLIIGKIFLLRQLRCVMICFLITPMLRG